MAYQDKNLNYLPYSARPFTQRPSAAPPYNPGPVQKAQPRYDPYVFDYKDPLQVNSLADVIFNQTALDKEYPKLFNWDGSPLDEIVQRIQGLLGVSYKTIVKPIVRGFTDPTVGVGSGFTGAGLNLLQNFGETMDVLANPIKGMILEEDGPLKGLTRGLGISADGRKNYDYDTGNVVADIALEVISDPFNWISFGAWGAAKTAAKSTMDIAADAARVATREVAEDVTAEVAQKFGKVFAKALRQTPDDIPGAVQKAVSAANLAFDSTAKTVLSRDAITLITTKLSTGAIDDMTINTLTSMKKLYDLSEGIQKTLAQGVGYSSGFLPAWKFLKGGYNLVDQFLTEKTYRGLRGLLGQWDDLPITQWADSLQVIADTSARPLRHVAADTTLAEDLGQALRISMIQQEQKQVTDIFKRNLKTDELRGTLNQLFNQKTGMVFQDYLTWLQDFTKQYPEFQVHNNAMQAYGRRLESVENYNLQHTLDPGQPTARRAGTRIGRAFLTALDQAVADNPKNVMQILEERGLSHLVQNTQALDTVSNLIVYKMMTSKAAAFKALLHAETFQALTQDALTRSGAFENLRKIWVPEMEPALAKIYKAIEGHQSVQLLMDNLSEDDILKPIFPQLYDAIIAFQNYKLPGMFTQQNYWIDQILDKVRVQITALEMRASHALDNLFTPEVEARFHDWLRQFPGVRIQAHDAEYDLFKTMYLFEDAGQLGAYKNLLDPDGKTVSIFVDIETTGLEGDAYPMLQLAWHSSEINGNQFVQLVTDSDRAILYPTDSVLRKLTGETNLERARAIYEARHYTGTQGNEKQILEQFIAQLKELSYAGKRVQLVGHNLNEFDFEFMLRRMKRNAIVVQDIEFFQRLGTLDTLELLYQKDGIYHLSKQQQDATRVYLKSYFAMRAQEVLSEGVEGKRFIDSIDKNVSQGIQELSEITERTSLNATPQRLGDIQRFKAQLDGVQAEIKATLQELYQKNTMLSGQEIYFDNARKMFLDADLNPIDSGGLINVSQIFAEQHGQLGEYAVRKVLDVPLVNKYFHLPAGQQLSRETMNKLMDIAQAIEYKTSAVRNINNVLLHQQDFNRIYIRLYDYMLNLPQERWQTQSLLPRELPQSPAEMYATLRYLYQTLEQDAKELGTLAEFQRAFRVLKEDGIAEGALYSVVNPRTMTNTYASDTAAQAFTPEQDTTRFFQAHKSELFNTGAELRADFQNLATDAEDLLKQISHLRIGHGITSAAVQAEETLLNPLRDVWTGVGDVIHRWRESVAGSLNPERDFNLLLGTKRDLIVQYADKIGVNELAWLGERAPTDIYQHLLQNAFGVITFEIPKYGSVNDALINRTIINRFVKQEVELTAMGIKIKMNEETNRFWIWLDQEAIDLEQALLNKTVDYADSFLRFDNNLAFPQELRSLQEQLIQATEHYTGIKSRGSLGDLMSFEHLEQIQKYAPQEIRESMIPASEWQRLKSFRDIHFNRSNIGMVEGRKHIEPFVSRNVMKNYTASIQNFVRQLDTKLKYKNMFFDEMFQINSETFREFSSRELREMLLQYPEYKLVALVQDNSPTGYSMKVLQMHSDALIDEARRLDAVLLPTHVYLGAFTAINESKIDNKVMRVLDRWVVGPMKTGFLSTIGWPFRNLIDSAAKNGVLAGEPGEAGLMLRHMLETARHYYEYTKILQQVLDAPGSTTGLFSQRILDAIYEAEPNQKLTKEMFQFYHDTLQQGAAAGLTMVQQKANKLKMVGKHNIAEKLIYENPWTSMIMGANGEIEQIMRLSGYTFRLMQGDTVDEAFYSVLKHHFDYSNKTKLQMYAEYVIPFFSFLSNNLRFWAEAIGKYGWVSTVARDIMTPIWNFDEYSQRELQENRSLQYQILSGNIVLPSNLVIKLNPSIMDAFRMMSDPNEGVARIAPYLRIPVDLVWTAIQGQGSWANTRKVLAQNLPLIGPTLQRYWFGGEDYEWGSALKAYDRTGSYLPLVEPSIFGGVQRNFYFVYPGSGQVFMTHSIDTFNKHVSRGASEFSSETALAGWISKQRIFPKYSKRYFARRYYAPKKQKKVFRAYARKTYAKKTYAQRSYVPRLWDTRTYNRVIRSGRGFRMPTTGRSIKVAPTIYRQLYTGTGLIRFQTRMIPITPAYLKSRLRQDWSHLRG